MVERIFSQPYAREFYAKNKDHMKYLDNKMFKNQGNASVIDRDMLDYYSKGPWKDGEQNTGNRKLCADFLLANPCLFHDLDMAQTGELDGKIIQQDVDKFLEINGCYKDGFIAKYPKEETKTYNDKCSEVANGYVDWAQKHATSGGNPVYPVISNFKDQVSVMAKEFQEARPDELSPNSVAAGIETSIKDLISRTVVSVNGESTFDAAACAADFSLMMDQGDRENLQAIVKDALSG